MDYNQEQYMRMQQYQFAPKVPFYMSYPIQNIYMTEMEYERDMERMKDLYPEEARRIQQLVEEECDKMEYEGSMMFDEYPDRMMVRVICNRIYDTVTEAPMMQEQELSEGELDAQQFGQGRPPQGPPPFGPPQGRPPQGPPPFGPPQGRPPQNQGLNTLIEILLLNEMYKRRCRHNRCRRWW